jgi:hypothetical protein
VRRVGGGWSHAHASRWRAKGGELVAAGLTLTRVGGARRGRAAAQSGVEAPTLCEALVLGGGEAMARLNLEIWPPVWALFCKLHVFFGTTTGLESDGLRWPFARLHSGARLHTIHRHRRMGGHVQKRRRMGGSRSTMTTRDEILKWRNQSNHFY